MASQAHALTRSLAKRGFSGFVRDDANYSTNAPIALRIKHTGNVAVTSVVVTSATNIVLTDATATVTCTFATYDTLGKVADYINSYDGWECRVLDALRSDASASMMVSGTLTAATVLGSNGELYYDCEVDTSALPGYTYCATPSRLIDGRSTEGHRVHIREVRYNANVGTAAADKFQIWERKGDVETQIYSALSVDSTGSTNSDTTITWASGYGYLTGSEGAELVVRITDAATVADDADAHLSVIGEIE